ncbi:hsp90-like protein [Phlyctema vagabunda]|uniref:Hsp90-like protein n=1 Tax=Phlyctema vagabunda TaxID=108571 RepID=A0ABR4PTK9_9HELO
MEWRGFGESATSISVLPLSSSGRLFGFLIIAMNPRRPLNDKYERFLRDLSRHLSTITSAIVNAEETRKQAERLERELADSETKIRYMAQHASVGMQHLAIDGTTLWANEQFYKLTGHPLPDHRKYKLSFLDVYLEADRPRAIDAWTRLLQGETDVSVELRLKRMFTPPNGEPEHACILALSFPYIESGKVKSIMTCTTDISQLKWAESSEARNARDALAAKHQQEEFIDVVSHEMRNPLSAIFQCADIIASCLADQRLSKVPRETLAEIVASNIDAAKTILMCASHQKRIVDDVLMLSKLEYMLLTISPSPVQPSQLVESVMRMFESDLLAHDITFRTTIGTSSNLENVDWILCDPSRVTQILINLLTNAIKFTKTEKKREITIRFGANSANPKNNSSKAIHWCPRQNTEADKFLDTPEWGNGEALYFSCAISDTGVGMTDDEITRVFSRFEQASSRTSIKYGGSGLGLFISQKLAEKHGGDIGVSSNPGKGSTFVFHVMGRRAEIEPLKPSTRPVVLRTRSSYEIYDKKPQSNNIHVLIVEDNLVNQQLLRKQLEKAKCVVYVANHGAEALDVLETTTSWHEKGPYSKHLDIILMDWEMPIMDGLTCSRQIRNLQRSGEFTKHIPIIAITANAREEQIEAALGAGIDSVLSKPFLVADLLLRMKGILGAAAEKAPTVVESPSLC